MKQLLILSGKGGTGKTTVAAAFIDLARAQACADCDVDAPNLHLVLRPQGEPERRPYFGLPKAVIRQEDCRGCGQCAKMCRFGAIAGPGPYVVDPFACEGCALCREVCPVGAIVLEPAQAGELMLYQSGRTFATARLKMGSGTTGKLVTEVKRLLADHAGRAPLGIVDGSPGIGCPVIASMSGVDLALIVTEPSLSGLSDLKRILGTAAVFRVPAAVCVNKADANAGLTEAIRQYCNESRIPFLGTIPYDPEALRASNEGRTLADCQSPAGEALGRIYKRTMELLQAGGSLETERN